MRCIGLCCIEGYGKARGIGDTECCVANLIVLSSDYSSMRSPDKDFREQAYQADNCVHDIISVPLQVDVFA